MMLRCFNLSCRHHNPFAAATTARSITTTHASLAKQFPPRPKPPPESEIEENYVKGSGPGGQKINKTNSAVQLKHLPTGIVVKSQSTRSRDLNRKHARELLAARLDELHNGDQSRSALVTEIKRKKATSASKKSRRKYRKLDEEKAAAAAAEGSEDVSSLEGIEDHIEPSGVAVREAPTQSVNKP